MLTKGGAYMADLVRLNVNIPRELSDWINDETKSTGVTKSSFIYFALRTYKDQQTMLKLSKQVDDMQKANK